VSPDPQYRADLFRGTAPYYDRYRPPYPAELWADLRRRLPVTGSGRLLDLACGTGQIAFPLAAYFTEVVAVDQEPDSVEYGRTKAATAGVDNITWVTGSAETVEPDGPFELIAVGNAFHRLKRSAVAARMMSWLRPGGGVALVWGGGPWIGPLPWQKAMGEVCADWMARADATDRVPAGWERAMDEDPHDEVLARAGFEYLGRFDFEREDAWTVETLVGFTYSTSFLNRQALGDKARDFEADFARRLGPYADGGTFRNRAVYIYELARSPIDRSPTIAAHVGA